MSALTEAIARSFTTREKQPPARSPLRALGRRQLSGAEVLAQSVATTAPAVSMVVLPVTMLTHGRLLSGMITINRGHRAGDAHSLLRFRSSTRRMAASGGLHSFVFRGLGTRAALTTGIRHAGQVRRQRGDDALSRRTGRNRNCSASQVYTWTRLFTSSRSIWG